MVNFPAVLLDHFRCSQCYSALSVGPVCCGPDGAPVCGRCSPSLRDVPNRPLQALMARYSFPCRYTTNGCKQFLPFGDVLHEQECQFQEDVSFEEAFDSIDPLITDDFKCFDCKKLLSVGPLNLTAAGDSVCGRCSDRWSQLYGEQTLIRNWKMEFAMQKMPLQCSYYTAGCRRALEWGEVQLHEDFCPYRACDCPATPHNSCQEVLPAANLFQHFQLEHLALALETPKFQECLTENSNTHRLLKLEEHVYLVMTKVNVAENRLWLSVTHIGDVDEAKHILFTLKISNIEETAHFLPTSQPVESDFMLRINEKTSVVIPIDGLRVLFRQPDLPYVMCSLTVSQEGSPPRKPIFKICKWQDCKQIGVEGKMATVADICNKEISHRELINHESVCDHRILSCEWPNCNQQLPANQMKSHETECDHRILSCKWTNCKQQLPVNQMEIHERNCFERIDKCRFEDCSIECSIKDWERHVTQCQHRYVEILKCCISGCKEEFLPPAMSRHVTSSHPGDIVEGTTVTRMFIRGNDSDNFVYFQYNVLLFRGQCSMDSDNCFVFYLRLLDAAEFQADYKYAIKVLSPPNDLYKTITREAECDKYIKLSANEFSPLRKVVIKFQWTIIKK